MAMTAWSAKVSSSAICLSVNGRTLDAATVMAPMRLALADERHRQHRS